MGQREDGDEEEKEEVVRGDGGRRVEIGWNGETQFRQNPSLSDLGVFKL